VLTVYQQKIFFIFFHFFQALPERILQVIATAMLISFFTTTLKDA